MTKARELPEGTTNNEEDQVAEDNWTEGIINVPTLEEDEEEDQDYNSSRLPSGGELRGRQRPSLKHSTTFRKHRINNNVTTPKRKLSQTLPRAIPRQRQRNQATSRRAVL